MINIRHDLQSKAHDISSSMKQEDIWIICEASEKNEKDVWDFKSQISDNNLNMLSQARNE